jgi:hypothetical protein
METKNCQKCKKDFVIESEDLNFYEKMKVPSPTFCYLCRAQRRFAFRNERVLYKKKSDFTGEEIFTMFSPQSGIKIYEREIWLSDKWNPMDYGQDYDFSKPFFTQFFELVKKVPFKNMNIVNGVSSPYTFNITDPKNCYLVFNASYVEDCMYSHGMGNCKWCLDCSHVSKCENSYEGFWITSCMNTSFSSMCENSFNLFLCKNCHGCNDCFGCVNLRKKSYCIFNKQCSREEYLEKIKEFNLGSYSRLEEVKQKAYKFWLQFPNKFIEGIQNTSVSGNYINHSKEVKNSFLIREGQNIHYCQYLQENIGSKDCWDYSVYGDNNQLLYECHSCGINTQNMKFCLHCEENVHDLECCIFCTTGSENLFGCVGLRKKQYCIFNKQYTKEEYFEMVEKIKKHMDDMPYIDRKGRIYKYGEYFPMELSPFAYNTTLAQEYFPLTKEEVEDNGNLYEDVSERNYKIDFNIGNLPDFINDVKDDIVGKVIACEHQGKCNQLCTTAFKILKDELNFYRRMKLPLPRLCPNCRTFERLKQRTGIKLYNRKCMNESCNNKFETNYSPDRSEIVYCEKCYQQEAY